MRTTTRTVLMLSGLALLQACATARVKVTREGGEPRHYQQLAVPPFENGVGSELPASAPEQVAGAVIAKAQEDGHFGRVSSTPAGSPNELVLRGTITEFNPGSKALRFLLIGLGTGGLQLDVSLVDGVSGEPVEQFSTSGAIVAGGVMGASMGVEDMIKSAAGKIGARVSRYGSSGGER